MPGGRLVIALLLGGLLLPLTPSGAKPLLGSGSMGS